MNARRLLGRLEEQSPGSAARALALAGAQLMTTARLAWWPWEMRGELSLSADEMPDQVLVERGWEDDWLGAPTRSRRTLYKEARTALANIVTAAERLDDRPETVRISTIEKAAYPAVDWAQNLLLLAVELCPDIVLESAWAGPSAGDDARVFGVEPPASVVIRVAKGRAQAWPFEAVEIHRPGHLLIADPLYGSKITSYFYAHLFAGRDGSWRFVGYDDYPDFALCAGPAQKTRSVVARGLSHNSAA